MNNNQKIKNVSSYKYIDKKRQYDDGMILLYIFFQSHLISTCGPTPGCSLLPPFSLTNQTYRRFDLINTEPVKFCCSLFYNTLVKLVEDVNFQPSMNIYLLKFMKASKIHFVLVDLDRLFPREFS